MNLLRQNQGVRAVEGELWRERWGGVDNANKVGDRSFVDF